MDIDKFLDDFDYILLDEHRQQIMTYRNFLSNYKGFFKVTSVYGEHYSCCMWANDNTTHGVDTCACHYAYQYTHEFEKLKFFYHKMITPSSKSL